MFSFAALLAYSIFFTFDYDRNYFVPVEVLSDDEAARRVLEGRA